MSNYGRDALWDAATWAQLDEVVAEEAKRVRVARKVFRTEDVRTTVGSAPYWVSRAEIETGGGLALPEEAAHPFVEISVPFRLTPAQADAEETLHAARTLARAAAKYLALAEDQIIFGGKVSKASRDLGIRASNTADLGGLTDLATPSTREAGTEFQHTKDGDAHEGAQKLVSAVNKAVMLLASDGWPAPFALVLGTGLYSIAYNRLQQNSEETAVDRFEGRLRHCVLSSALDDDKGILVSLAGDPTTIYTSGETSVALSGEDVDGEGGPVYGFRVFERFQYVVRQPSSMRLISRVDEPRAQAPTEPAEPKRGGVPRTRGAGARR